MLGANGATAIYGPQKGASKQDIEQLENALAHLAGYFENQFERNIAGLKGGGAAGGTAAGMVGFFEAELSPGFQLLAEMIELEKSN